MLVATSSTSSVALTVEQLHAWVALSSSTAGTLAGGNSDTPICGLGLGAMLALGAGEMGCGLRAGSGMMRMG